MIWTASDLDQATIINQIFEAFSNINTLQPVYQTDNSFMIPTLLILNQKTQIEEELF